MHSLLTITHLKVGIILIISQLIPIPGYDKMVCTMDKNSDSSQVTEVVQVEDLINYSMTCPTLFCYLIVC